LGKIWFYVVADLACKELSVILLGKELGTPENGTSNAFISEEKVHYHGRQLQMNL
jgi:hypothetical protein